MGRGAVQKILAEHGITSVLAAEGGRTSRGSINNMRAYVSLLNDLEKEKAADLDAIEKFWIDEVRRFFNATPFKLKYDQSKGLREVVHNLIEQAVERQREAGGAMYAGAVLQHLVGAKLDCALGVGSFEHNSFSTSDQQSDRAGDFLVNDVAIHVTTAPGEAVLSRCRQNLANGLNAIIVTLPGKMAALQQLAENQTLGDRIDCFDIEQFIALNLFEFSKFSASERKPVLNDLIERYNQIIAGHETDASLRIDVK